MIMKKLLSIGLFVIMIVVLVSCNSAAGLESAGKKSFSEGNYEKAAENFSKAIEKNPNRADYYIEYGLTLVALGKYKEALEQFDSVYIKANMSIVNENNKRLLRGKGIAYYQLHDYKKAITEFEQAIQIHELSKLNVDIYSYMGSAYRLTGSYQKAIDTYTLILKENKKNANAYCYRAYCYQIMGKFEDSKADYDYAISLEPNNFEYYLGKYELMMVSGKEEDAKKTLSEASNIKVKTEEDKYNLAKLVYYKADYKTALEQFENSVKAGFVEGNYYMGEVYRMKKEYAKALSYYDQYIKSGKSPTAKAYNQAAVCLIKNGTYDKALEYLKLGLTLEDMSCEQLLLKNEIVTFEHMSEYKKADEVLQNYLKDYPDDKTAVREEIFIDSRIQ